MDQMNLYLNLDTFQHDNFSPLASHTSVWSTESPFDVSGIVNITKPIFATINNYLTIGNRPELFP